MKKTTNQTTTILIVAISFAMHMLVGHYAKDIHAWLDGFIPIKIIRYVVTYLITGIPLYIGAVAIAGFGRVAASLGISGGLLRGLGLALLFTLPMLIPALFTFEPRADRDIDGLISGTLVAGFMEELYFRGFLFGLLFRNTRIGFVLSILFGALLFGAGHLYQSQDPLQLAGIFLVTSIGAVWFAWHYVEWGYNLWVPIFLHILMNLSWAIAGTTTNALGNVDANVFRFLTVIGSVVFTVWYKRRKGIPFAVNRQTWWYLSK